MAIHLAIYTLIFSSTITFRTPLPAFQPARVLQLYRQLNLLPPLFLPASLPSLNCAYHSVVCSFSKSSKLLLLSTNVSGTLLVPFVLLSIAPL